MVDVVALAEAFEAAARGALAPYVSPWQHLPQTDAVVGMLMPFDSKVYEQAKVTESILRSIAAVYRRAAIVGEAEDTGK